MKKPFLLLFYLYISISLFAQAQFPIGIVNYILDFESLDNIVPKNDVLRFHNITQHLSPVDFYLQASDQALMSINVFPYSYLEVQPNLTDFRVFNIVGHLHISTFFYTTPISFILFNNIRINSFNSELELIHYLEDYFIEVQSGKITITLNNKDIPIVAGQSVLLHQNGSCDILQDIDFQIYNHQQLTNFMVNKSSLLHNTKEKLNQITIDDYDRYIYYYILTSFFDNL